MSAANVPSAQVLKNKGIPVSCHVLAVGEDGRVRQPYERVFGEDGEPVLEVRWVQFSNAVLTEIEEHFGGLEDWEAALSATPNKSLAVTLALVFQLWVPGVVDAEGRQVPDRARVGYMMRDSDADTYATAVGAGFAQSQGVSPEQVGELVRAGVRQAEELRPAIDAQVSKMLKEAEENVQRELAALRVDVATQTSPEATPAEASLGVNGSEPGFGPDEPSTSSGG